MVVGASPSAASAERDSQGHPFLRPTGSPRGDQSSTGIAIIKVPARPFLLPVFEKYGADAEQVARRFLERVAKTWAAISGDARTKYKYENRDSCQPSSPGWREVPDEIAQEGGTHLAHE